MNVSALPALPEALLQRAWDVIRIPRFAAALAMRHLDAPGPVVVDPSERLVHFLVPAGTAHDWAVDGTEALAADQVPLPASDKRSPPGPYWLLAFDPPVPLTDPCALRSALLNHGRPEAQLTAEQGGPRCRP